MCVCVFLCRDAQGTTRGNDKQGNGFVKLVIKRKVAPVPILVSVLARYFILVSVASHWRIFEQRDGEAGVSSISKALLTFCTASCVSYAKRLILIYLYIFKP